MSELTTIHSKKGLHSQNSANGDAGWPQPLLELLARQQGMVDQLVELAQSQARLIAANHTDQLLAVLSRRQALIDEFTASQSDLNRLTQGLDARRETISTEQRDQIKSLIGTIGQRLAQVMRHDEQDQAALKTNRQQIKHELSTFPAARQARTAYLGTSASNTHFADQRG